MKTKDCTCWGMHSTFHWKSSVHKHIEMLSQTLKYAMNKQGMENDLLHFNGLLLFVKKENLAHAFTVCDGLTNSCSVLTVLSSTENCWETSEKEKNNPWFQACHDLPSWLSMWRPHEPPPTAEFIQMDRMETVKTISEKWISYNGYNFRLYNVTFSKLPLTTRTNVTPEVHIFPLCFLQQ